IEVVAGVQRLDLQLEQLLDRQFQRLLDLPDADNVETFSHILDQPQLSEEVRFRGTAAAERTLIPRRLAKRLEDLRPFQRQLDGLHFGSTKVTLTPEKSAAPSL